MAEYRKKPEIIEAVQFNGFNNENGQAILSERPKWLTKEFGINILFFQKPNTLTIRTLEGDIIASVGDYIIRGIQGELYSCKPDIFEATYEPV